MQKYCNVTFCHFQGMMKASWIYIDRTSMKFRSYVTVVGIWCELGKSWTCGSTLGVCLLRRTIIPLTPNQSELGTGQEIKILRKFCIPLTLLLKRSIKL